MAFTMSPEPNAQGPDSIFHPDEQDIQLDEIQGNVLGGFKTARQKLMFLKIADVDMPQFRAWLAQAPIATARQVIDSNRAVEKGAPVPLQDAWLNIAFSYSMLRRLTQGRKDLQDADFEDQAFKAGMTARSGLLGDARDVKSAGNPAKWVVGGAQPVDVMLTLAHDDSQVLDASAARIREALATSSIVHIDDGAKLQGSREHFGFKDGISQPDVRGYESRTPPVPVAARRNSSNANQGLPGQDLVWPGEFVFGYYGEAERDDAASGHSDKPVSAGPAWAANGSFVVFRRLEQRVSEFHRFVEYESKRRKFPVLWFASMLFGRWPSGAPRLRAPENDNQALGESSCANNNFLFNVATPPLRAAAAGSGACDDSAGGGKSFAPAVADPHGAICMFASHIRKVYARDDQPGREAQRRRILRRGIPYGPASPSTLERPANDDGKERGLLFVAYQTSIVRQFEGITRQANDPDFRMPGAGRDAIIGQNNDDPDRSFTLDLKTVSPKEPWVIPTGGEYFFAPSLSALHLLSNP